jgi:hypothetical protein
METNNTTSSNTERGKSRSGKHAKSNQAKKATLSTASSKKATDQKQTLSIKDKTSATTTNKKQQKTRRINIDEAQRREMIAQSAYLLAEKREFKDGDPTQDWLMAEAEVDTLIKNVPSNQAAIQ